jgi:hypothetical protein
LIDEKSLRAIMGERQKEEGYEGHNYSFIGYHSVWQYERDEVLSFPHSIV